jgi:hypothetical protein
MKRFFFLAGEELKCKNHGKRSEYSDEYTGDPRKIKHS